MSVRGRRWRVASTTLGDECEALRLTALGTPACDAPLTILVPFDRPILHSSAQTPAVLRPRHWFHELDRAIADARPFGGPAATARARIRLIAYQLEPALAVLRGGATHLLIADAVGLGKTIQAGILLAELQALDDGFRAIVLAPAGLREQWSNELRAHFGLAAAIVDAAWLQRAIADRPRRVNPWSLPGIYIASHDFVKRAEALRPLDDVCWDLAIVDEAHHAGPGTDRCAAVDAIASRSVRVVLLTATPPVDPHGFDALCRIGRTASEDPPLVFARARTDVEAAFGKSERKSTVLAVVPSDAEARMHALLERYSREIWHEARARNDEGARLASIVLRKRALSSAGSLAASVERRLVLLVSPDAEQMTLRLGDADEDPLEDDLRASVLAVPGLADSRREKRWLSAIAEAARAAARAETKIACLVRLLRRIQEPVIVFTEYRDTLQRLHRRLSSTGRSIVLLHGGMDPRERALVPRAFEEGALTLLATDAAAEGLNLHHRCRVVVHYELPWNPARLEQRAGRVDRFGQQKRVHEIALVASSMAERLVVAPLTIRAARARSDFPRTRMIEALTESRVADAVMSGASDAAAFDERPQPRRNDDADRSILSADATREAARLENVRALSMRSPADRQALSLREAPFVTRATLRRSRDASPIIWRNSLVLAYLISIQLEDERAVHEEIFTLAVPSIDGRLLKHTAALRTLVEPYANPSGVVARAIEDRTRSVVERIEPAEARRHSRIHDRWHIVNAVQRSAAQILVQLGLFSRRRRSEAETSVEPITVVQRERSGSPLQVRTRLAAAIHLERRS